MLNNKLGIRCAETVDKKIMLSRIQRLAFNKINCNFCIDNNFTYWGPLCKIYE